MQGVALGSPAYMPPEQIRSAKDVTPVSDLYALGASFYQLVTGALPFDGRTAPEVMTKVLREEVKPIAEAAPDVPPAIAGFIIRTLGKDPAGRPAERQRLHRRARGRAQQSQPHADASDQARTPAPPGSAALSSPKNQAAAPADHRTASRCWRR